MGNNGSSGTTGGGAGPTGGGNGGGSGTTDGQIDLNTGEPIPDLVNGKEGGGSSGGGKRFP
eukprot:CAMPEP_0113885536 /NCGR_PEP_ID=MMETSP0780_2-20120614/10970_1 /TAXON_ID=652834 /ORGANISM="Palpitomonas bilix" /LENGTH=60 /DNA_ID=CAMNT_0000873483 /DNA_START=123 /DNA_END=305 /DNA_ORIENTATION=- /assembly_acc=CAM_ASM_000599